MSIVLNRWIACKEAVEKLSDIELNRLYDESANKPEYRMIWEACVTVMYDRMYFDSGCIEHT